MAHRPFRRDRFLEIWTPALDRALAYGAKAAFLTRNEDDTLHLRQVTVWESRADHERWWFSDELSALRQEALCLLPQARRPALACAGRRGGDPDQRLALATTPGIIAGSGRSEIRGIEIGGIGRSRVPGWRRLPVAR